MSNILLKSKEGKEYIVKRSEIRRVETNLNKETVVNFVGKRNTPIKVSGTVSEFYNSHFKR